MGFTIYDFTRLGLEVVEAALSGRQDEKANEPIADSKRASPRENLTPACALNRTGEQYHGVSRMAREIFSLANAAQVVAYDSASSKLDAIIGTLISWKHSEGSKFSGLGRSAASD